MQTGEKSVASRVVSRPRKNNLEEINVKNPKNKLAAAMLGLGVAPPAAAAPAGQRRNQGRDSWLTDQVTDGSRYDPELSTESDVVSAGQRPFVILLTDPPGRGLFREADL